MPQKRVNVGALRIFCGGIVEGGADGERQREIRGSIENVELDKRVGILIVDMISSFYLFLWKVDA
jgi:hypothetical protein